MKISKELCELIQEKANKDPEKEYSGMLKLVNGKIELIDFDQDLNDDKTAVLFAESYIHSVIDGSLVGLVHSHNKYADFAFSEADLKQVVFSTVPWYLFIAENQERSYLVHYGAIYEGDFNGIPREEVQERVFY